MVRGSTFIAQRRPHRRKVEIERGPISAEKGKVSLTNKEGPKVEERKVGERLTGWSHSLVMQGRGAGQSVTAREREESSVWASALARPTCC
jgi:hypothetical protein